ncbi:hypothetical protein MtrunA17_Chr1g0199741 [Medicago truncatula]|uniref:Uncharacterized protein n=1 Tax=Medicago truncatula TaxID=3880 RepID=A0A396JT54_MEDTR|nr:hypothetical protein MtrunA17_Chr1g0199741 [Medicago truncatula]
MGCYTKWDDARTFKCCELLHGLGEHLKQQDGVHKYLIRDLVKKKKYLIRVKE